MTSSSVDTPLIVSVSVVAASLLLPMLMPPFMVSSQPSFKSKTTPAPSVVTRLFIVTSPLATYVLLAVQVVVSAVNWTSSAHAGGVAG